LNGIWKNFDKIANRYGLQKIKTIGDAYMVAAMPTHLGDIGGAYQIVDSQQNETDNVVDSTVRACLYSLEVLEALQAANQKMGTKFSGRIGMHTGPVVAGVIQCCNFGFDLWGDAVNVAARIESSATPNCVYMSSATAEILQDRQFHFVKKKSQLEEESFSGENKPEVREIKSQNGNTSKQRKRKRENNNTEKEGERKKRRKEEEEGEEKNKNANENKNKREKEMEDKKVMGSFSFRIASDGVRQLKGKGPLQVFRLQNYSFC